ncbi:flagellar biosynthesis anti-sigma factor FlgM [Xanthomonas albilineans]|uniref:flagellar biosynthesis anti-sigma factor FlgM n=1 Tax=Xanthomonas albilineans TaxID=29447 RepID=UPI0005F32487|nr:flagellar biosynthesis anti-sigma factor FlgM [Xanthomonas albilineans]PPU95056.1 flagellar biosynthesis anti-sigma factor FlgM [Xanthomonas albilineans]
MSQKIEGTLSTSATHRTSSVRTKSASGASEEGQSREVGATAATDSLRLTGEASGLQNIQRELAAAPAVDKQRVEAVRTALQNGSYTINPEAIASRMIDMDRQLRA